MTQQSVLHLGLDNNSACNMASFWYLHTILACFIASACNMASYWYLHNIGSYSEATEQQQKPFWAEKLNLFVFGMVTVVLSDVFKASFYRMFHCFYPMMY